MLRAMIGRLLAATAFLLCGALFTPAHAQETVRAAAVVELYTSQGCNQCPRANRLLGMFSREDNVLALTFPVPIWDYLGWRDTFAEREFADRHYAYSRSLHVRGRFTPQLVFNGTTQASASYWDEARAMLDQARSQSLPSAPSISIARMRHSNVRVSIGDGTRRADAAVWIIAYDPGPISTYVTRGANFNRRIYHYNLATSIELAGAWNGEAVTFDRSRCTPSCAVIVQEPEGGRILAAAYAAIRNY
jgi:hypothetical protein